LHHHIRPCAHSTIVIKTALAPLAKNGKRPVFPVSVSLITLGLS
jgi:hypothetical protein